jgi:adenylylsulfate kinase
MATNITWHHSHLTREDRESLLNQRGVTLWFTGLSGAGKSTVATALEHELFTNKKSTYILDGDNIRHGLCSDLGFGPGDRQENIRRIGEVCNLFTDAGIIVLAAFVSPYKADRDNVRQLLDKTPGRKNFIEVHVQADVETCEQRDPKGLYKKAKAGEIQNFTGISAPFEAPDNPELVLKTGEKSVEECVSELMNYLREGGYIS